MTSLDLLRLLVRRWYVMAFTGVLGLGALAMVWQHPTAVYFTRFDVVLLAPRHVPDPNEMEDPSFSLAPLAGLLVSDVLEGERLVPMATSDATLVGEGVRDGWSVRLPNTGNQWVPSYTRPNIDVQVVGADEDRVIAEAARVRALLDGALDRRQEQFGVALGLRTTLMSSPADPVVSRVVGSRSRAAAGVLLLTLVGALLAAAAVDALVGRMSASGRWRRRTMSVPGRPQTVPPEPIRR